MSHRARRRFRIEENVSDPEGRQLALHNDQDEIVCVHESAFVLAGFAFASGADEVSHNHDIVKREGSR